MNSEDKALSSILAGQKYEKKVMVGYEKKKKKHGDIEGPLTEIMKEARMPWFCPKCDHIMKARLDRKMWMLFNHCFECQIEEEHELRVNGTFVDYENKKYFANRLSAIKDQIVSITEWLDASPMEVVEPVNIDTGFVHVDKYEKPAGLINEAKEALEQLKDTEKEVIEILDKLDAKK